jgi:hypothetical protein
VHWSTLPTLPLAALVLASAAPGCQGNVYDAPEGGAVSIRQDVAVVVDASDASADAVEDASPDSAVDAADAGEIPAGGNAYGELGGYGLTPSNCNSELSHSAGTCDVFYTCRIACKTDDECPPLSLGGARPTCTSDGTSAGVCVLPCDAGETCAAGMQCVDDFRYGEICMWPSRYRRSDCCRDVEYRCDPPKQANCCGNLTCTLGRCSAP